MTVLKVIPGQPWPLDAVTQKFAWLGRTSSGKTFACKRFVEQMLKASAQVIVVDSVGVWHGLRQGDHGFDIPVLGGLYGDIPLEPTAGALVAEVAVSSSSSLVLDVSQMNDAQRARFMEALGRRLFELKKASPSAMHLVLDEGQDSVPQNAQPNENMMLHEWVRICKQGRAFGMGVSIVSQRPQEISKKALNQVECVLAFQITGAHERKALEYWLSDKGIDTKLAQTLPTLEVGTPFLWSPQWLKVAEVTKRVLHIESADTSQTPKVGDAPRARAAMKPIDLHALEKSMAEMVEKVKDSDPALLRRRIQELEAQLAGAPQESRLNELLDMIRARDRQLALGLDESSSAAVNIAAALDALSVSAKKLGDVLLQCKQQPLGLPPPAAPHAPPRPAKRSAKPPQVAAVPAPPKEITGLPPGEVAVLVAAFQYGERGAPLAAISLMTGYKKRSIQNFIVNLRAHPSGPLVERGDRCIIITDAGKKLIPKGTRPYPRGKKLLAYLIDTLPAGESKTLAVAAAAHPKPVSLKQVSEQIDHKLRSVQNYAVGLVARMALRRAGTGQVALHQDVLS